MNYISKGKVMTIEEAGVRVQSALKAGDITKPLTVSGNIDKGLIKKGMKVVYVVFDDMTGAVIAVL